MADGRADYAAIDALSWVIIQRYDRFAADLVVVGHTPASPALPYITAQPNLAQMKIERHSRLPVRTVTVK